LQWNGGVSALGFLHGFGIAYLPFIHSFEVEIEDINILTHIVSLSDVINAVPTMSCIWY